MKKRVMALLLCLAVVVAPFVVGCDALADRSHPWTDDKGVLHDRKSCDWETYTTYMSVPAGTDGKGNMHYIQVPQYHHDYECVYY